MDSSFPEPIDNFENQKKENDEETEIIEKLKKLKKKIQPPLDLKKPNKTE
ncbi:hypothetical protein [Nostoc sp.]